MTTRHFKPIELTMDHAKRFWSKVDKSPGQGPKGKCWIWKGALDRFGYGTMRVGAFTILVHRVSYTLRFGVIPKGMHVLHKCDTYSCVRHLYAGTQLQNMKDCRERNRNNKAKGSSHGCSKLTEIAVKKIRKMQGTTLEISRQFGVSQSLISMIKLHQIWKHVS